MAGQEGLTAIEVAGNLKALAKPLNLFGLHEPGVRDLYIDARRGPEHGAMVTSQVIDNDGKPRWLLTRVDRSDSGREIKITSYLAGEVDTVVHNDP